MADTAVTGLLAITSITTDDILYAVDGALNSRKITFGNFQTSLSITTSNLASPTGTATNVVTGTAGTSGNLASWNATGDAVDASIAAADVGLEYLTPNAQIGTAYTLALTDRGQVVTMNNAAANTLTIPTNATVAFDTGTVISIIQLGAGVTTITATTGVTLNGVSAGSGAINTRYNGVSLLKIGTDTWVASGDIATVA